MLEAVGWHTLPDLYHQWRNRGRGKWGGGQTALKFSWGNNSLPTGKRGAKKEGKMERKRRKIWKWWGGKLKMEGEKLWKWAEDLFFLFCFVLFCFVACHFLKPLKIVWSLQNGQFLQGKSIYHAGKKSGKVTLSLWKIFLLCQCVPYEVGHSNDESKFKLVGENSLKSTFRPKRAENKSIYENLDTKFLKISVKF